MLENIILKIVRLIYLAVINMLCKELAKILQFLKYTI